MSRVIKLSRVIEIADIDSGAVVPCDGDAICRDGELVRLHPDVPCNSPRFGVPVRLTRHLTNPILFFRAALQLVTAHSTLESVSLMLTYDQWNEQYGGRDSTWPVPRFREAVIEFGRRNAKVCFDFADNGVETLSYAYAEIPGLEQHIPSILARIAGRHEVMCTVDVTDMTARNPRRPLLNGWHAVTHLGNPRCVIGPLRTLSEQLAQFAATHDNVPTRYSVDRRRDGSWMYLASFRWPYSHALITDAVLGLHALCLPTYVLYWIIDKLPPMQQWTEYKKIALIHSLLASIKKVSK